MLCFTKLPVSKRYMDKEGGVSRFSVETLLSRSTKIFRRGTLLCCVSQNYRYRKGIWIRRGGVSRFSVETLLSRSTKIFRRGTLLCCVSQNYRYRKGIWIRRGGGYQDFPSKLCCLAVPKIFVGEPFCAVFHKTTGIEKVYG